MALRFIKQLPSGIMSIYQMELKSLEKKTSSVETLLLQDIANTFIEQNSDQGDPEFLKKYVPPSASAFKNRAA